MRTVRIDLGMADGDLTAMQRIKRDASRLELLDEVVKFVWVLGVGAFVASNGATMAMERNDEN